MTNREHLVDRHIKEHEARLKHIDELMEHAEQAITSAEQPEELGAELTALKDDREKLHSDLEEMRQQSEIAWTEKGGPMVIWELVAERLENLVERIGGSKTRH